MEVRKQQLLEIESYIGKVDNDLCLALQSLQWDRNKVIQGIDSVTCAYNKNHRIPASKREEHEKWCMLRSLGYTEDDKILPEPAYPQSKACLQLNKHDIEEIIENASKGDPVFKKGISSNMAEPLTLDRIQTTYTCDERRAIYDAVVAKAPMLHDDDGDFIFTRVDGSQKDGQEDKQKSRLEILAEQRDMKRRRQKYRVTTKHKNYSQVLREVIHNQMELYHETQINIKPEQKQNLPADDNSKYDSKKRRRSNDDIDCVRHKDRKDYMSKGDERSEKSSRDSSRSRFEVRDKKYCLERSDDGTNRNKEKYNDRHSRSYYETRRDGDKHKERRSDYKEKRYNNERKVKDKSDYRERDNRCSKESTHRETRDDCNRSKYETDYKYREKKDYSYKKDYRRSHNNKY